MEAVSKPQVLTRQTTFAQQPLKLPFCKAKAMLYRGFSPALDIRNSKASGSACQNAFRVLKKAHLSWIFVDNCAFFCYI
jgi:hypothetical protein